MPTDASNRAGRSDRGAITVLGAGIVGTCCALALQREGFSVTLIDRDTPGAGTSSGNAGLIQTGTPMPMATPGMLRKVPAMLLDPKGSLVIRWRYLPRLLPWLWRFLRQSSARRTEANARAQMRLLDHVGDAYRELVRAAGAEDMLRYKGLLFVYRGAADARDAEWEMDMFRRHGVRVDAVSADELRQMEPALNREYTHGFHLPDCFYTVDPKHLAERLAEAFEKWAASSERPKRPGSRWAKRGQEPCARPPGPSRSNVWFSPPAFSRRSSRRNWAFRCRSNRRGAIT